MIMPPFPQSRISSKSSINTLNISEKMLNVTCMQVMVHYLYFLFFFPVNKLNRGFSNQNFYGCYFAQYFKIVHKKVFM